MNYNFSDGEGGFQHSKPKEFDTFFVVPQVNGYQAIDCPEWIRKIYIQVERGELFE